MDRAMIDSYRPFLSEAARLYEKHKTGHPEPFNVFSVLRSESDEVNLHSRFLHALLNHQQPPDGTRDNLADFLRSDFLRELSSRISVDSYGLDPNHANVDREIDNIDILIRDPTSRPRQAVVVENKIWGKDQPQQLKRYAKQLKKEGYTPYLLYLTLHGHKPSEDSACGLDYECISYKKDLLPWLRRCQKRAYDNPPLRESVAQYRHLIAKLTGEISEAYMKELKELCLQDNNIVLVHDLNEAVQEAKILLLQKLWSEIDHKLQEEIPDLHDRRSNDSNISESIIREVVTDRGTVHGLFYSLSPPAKLGVEVSFGYPFICFGVQCPQKENEASYNRFKKALGETRSNEWWPWYQYAPTSLNLRNPTREDLELLAHEEKRQGYIKELVSEVRNLWERIKEAELA